MSASSSTTVRYVGNIALVARFRAVGARRQFPVALLLPSPTSLACDRHFAFPVGKGILHKLAGTLCSRSLIFRHNCRRKVCTLYIYIDAYRLWAAGGGQQCRRQVSVLGARFDGGWWFWSSVGERPKRFAMRTGLGSNIKPPQQTTSNFQPKLAPKETPELLHQQHTKGTARA